MFTSHSSRVRARGRTAIAAGLGLMGVALVGAMVWAPGWAHAAMNTLDPVSLIGHLSFLLSALSFAQTNMLRLRLLAIASMALGLVYNGIIHVQMPQGMQLWPTLIWLSAFLVQNCILAYALVTRRSSAPPVLRAGVLVLQPAASSQSLGTTP